MFKRTETYEQFICRHPDAEFLAVNHANGFKSEIAPGVHGGSVVELFVGVYDQLGGLVSEQIVQEAHLQPPSTLISEDPQHPYVLGRAIAESAAASPERWV